MRENKIKKLIEKRIDGYGIVEFPCKSVDPNAEVLLDRNSTFSVEKLKDFCFYLVSDICQYDRSVEKVEEIEEEINH